VTMLCAECQNYLTDYIDNDLSAAARRRVEEHIAKCAPCEHVHDDLARIVQASSTLPLHTPSSQLWARIQEEVASEPASAVPFLSRRISFSVTARQLTAAAALAVSMTFVGALALRSAAPVAPGAAGWQGLTTGDRVRADQLGQISRLRVVDEFAGVAATLDTMKRSIDRESAGWSPQLRESFERQLAVLDAGLAEAEASCGDARADTACRERLSAAYQAKLRFLEQVAKAGE